VFERRSCGTGTRGQRFSDWALIATASPRHFLLIRRLIPRPDALTFYLCYAPEDRPATMTYFITIAGRRWSAEETFKTGKDLLGWDQSQARTWDAACRHTALSALAQLRQVAIRNAICGLIGLLPAGTPASRTPPATAQTVTTPTLTTLTCASPSATRPYPITPASPARPGWA
jgi:hypothetical protein